MYVDLERRPAPPAAAPALAAIESIGEAVGSARAESAQMQSNHALNAPARAQAQLGQALNQRGAVVAQQRMAQALSGRNAVQREQSLDDEDLIQQKPVAHPVQRDALAEDEVAQQKSAAKAVQGEAMRVAERVTLRSAPVQRADAPVQRVPYWMSQLPGLGVLGAAAGAGGYLGLKAGAALGSLAGPAGSALGSFAGAAGGALLGAWGALRGQSAYEGSLRPPIKGPLSIPEIFNKRLGDLKDRDNGPKDAELQYLEPALRPKVKDAKTVYDAKKAIEEHYKGQIVTEGEQYVKDTQFNKELSAVLKKNPLMVEILHGNLTKRGGEPSSADRKENEGPPLAQGNLAIPGNAPQHVKEAKRMFDKLVARTLPAISSISRGLTPDSAMGHEGDLYLGWGTPPGAVVHEFGHHLEQNLLPHEIASVHNFLRARSKPGKSGSFRRVGQEPTLGLPQSSTGYDIEQPTLDIASPKSLPSVAANMASFLAGSESGGEGIDRFVMVNSDRPDFSYNTKVYGASTPLMTVGGLDTEYLSTTIHFFSNPQTANELVNKDPLRVCLFLSLAQPTQYAAVAETFERETGQNLDALIHRIGGRG